MKSPVTMTALDQSNTSARSIIPAAVGFFFVARYCLTFLLFQNNPATGSLVIIAAGVAFTYAAVFTNANYLFWNTLRRTLPVRLTLLYLAFVGLSILWTGAASRTIAFAYWAGMAADVVTVLVLLSPPLFCDEHCSQLLKGSVWGAVLLAFVGWLSPTMPDLRLGDAVFLHPNTLGLQLGLCSLIAFHLSRKIVFWRWIGLFLSVTLLRTLSKTSIVAFLVAAGWTLLCDRHLTFSRKAWLLSILALLVACFAGLFIAYLQIYMTAGTGNQVETLTGRTVLWATAIGIGIHAPWFGHGFYSFRSLIPAFGDFEPWHAHNELIQVFFEFGITGLVLAVLLYWSFIRIVRNAYSELRVLITSLLIFCFVHGLTDTVPFGFSLPLWLLVAFSVDINNASLRMERVA